MKFEANHYASTITHEVGKVVAKIHGSITPVFHPGITGNQSSRWSFLKFLSLGCRQAVKTAAFDTAITRVQIPPSQPIFVLIAQ